MRQAYLSYGLVIVQFVCIGIIAATGPWIARSAWGLVLEGIGFLVGVWAILAMGVGNLNVTPEIRTNAQLVQRGPYRVIRHPMYTAVLVVGGGLVLDRLSPLRVATWLILAGIILIKLHYEETLLEARFAAYREYQRTTYKLIPYLY